MGEAFSTAQRSPETGWYLLSRFSRDHPQEHFVRLASNNRPSA